MTAVYPDVEPAPGTALTIVGYDPPTAHSNTTNYVQIVLKLSRRLTRGELFVAQELANAIPAGTFPSVTFNSAGQRLTLEYVDADTVADVFAKWDSLIGKIEEDGKKRDNHYDAAERKAREALEAINFPPPAPRGKNVEG